MVRREKLPLLEILLERELVGSEREAKSLIMQGRVHVNRKLCKGVGTRFPVDAVVEVRSKACPYVSRAGLKLATFLRSLGKLCPQVQDSVCLDVGSGHGGFTQVLLEGGARSVYAVDVGKGLMDASLRSNERLRLIEGFNARFLSKSEIPEPINLFTLDVSFISGSSLLKVIRELEFAKEGRNTPAGIFLCKPQFEREINPEDEKRGYFIGGVIKSPALLLKTLGDVYGEVVGAGFVPLNLSLAVPRGAKGNFEFFILLKPNHTFPTAIPKSASETLGRDAFNELARGICEELPLD